MIAPRQDSHKPFTDIRGSGAINELLRSHGFNFRKSLGQNFLVDANITEKMVRASGIDKSCGVLEVGPGIGALTGCLVSSAARVVAVELDRRLAEILEEITSEAESLVIIRGDILKLDIALLVRENMAGLRARACANLPYNITTPALTALVNAGVFEEITVMVQREVARRICSSPGTREYGALSVFAQYHSLPKIEFDVPPECFIPKPKVFSSVVTMKIRPDKLLSQEMETIFFKSVRAAFGQRRKTLVNALLPAFGNVMSKDEVAGIVKRCGFNVSVRGESLSVEDFIRLSASLYSVCG